MNDLNTFSVNSRGDFMNFSISFDNGYTLSTLLCANKLSYKFDRIEIAIVYNDQLIHLSGEDNIAFVNPKELAQIISLLASLSLKDRASLSLKDVPVSVKDFAAFAEIRNIVKFISSNPS